MKSYVLSTLATYLASAAALSIAEVNGPAWLSPYNGKAISNVTGLVTAVGSAGFYLQDVAPSNSAKFGKKSFLSSGIYVFNSTAAKTVVSGDIVTIGDSRVTEYRSSSAYIYLTEIINPTNIVKVSSGNTVTPIILGKTGLSPPTTQYSALDNGDIFGLPNGASLLSTTNATLTPTKYGLDFWESLVGSYVQITAPVALGTNSNYGDVWVRGDWKVTGLNKAGGLTITTDSSTSDANPEAILIGDPLDGTNNVDVKLGDVLGPIEGVVTYAFGFYRILPKTAITVTSASSGVVPPTTLVSKGSCKGITIGQYNVENLTPKSSHLPALAAHIVDYLKTPDLLFVQEVQDNDGTINAGITSANETLAALSAEVAALSGITYSSVEIAPENGKDGGAPGGNIRVAYLYNPTVLSLTPGTAGNATAGTAILPSGALTYNPGRIDPTNVAFTSSRKPLVACFTIKSSKKPLYAINVHSGSKGGSSSLHGDSRPPINGGIEDRLAQAAAMKPFIASILAVNADAHIIAAGDFNEFSGVAPQELLEEVMYDLDVVAGIKKEERYTYLYDMNSQQLDHILVSKALSKKVKALEHVHVNTHGAVEVSDHDPSVALFKDIC
ncbi:Endonuclease/exonuclease/phosphatase [Tricharina praecox]|uniref:Endonuclease/exonuclease/phosphatase n=1 Tax=Tricharina praecox TaxID=43433 RepID=UPI002220290F|nr:Endonuclease/exonuclease/phosphatase [Tricharina praecox]KAI5857843.1 Endonuclease/exonuclease/phosphatase [Tricharina praecox]